jgi:hypothetical protein
MTSPQVFLSHASEDKPLAERIARDLVANGIGTFFDRWEIRSGDSIRQRLDEGLGACTHFVLLATPISLTKRWVKAEIDAAFLRKVEEQCRFIALRVEVKPAELPPLLAALHSPSLDLSRYDDDLRTLIGDIHGVNRKPALGAVPAFAAAPAAPAVGLSAHAAAVARYLVERSEHGFDNDPDVPAKELAEALGLTMDELLDAVEELEAEGCAMLHEYAGGRDVAPTEAMFPRFDRFWTDHDAEQDAVRVATHLLDQPQASASSPELAECFGWTSRRLNPAIQFLLSNGLIEDDPTLVFPWLRYRLRANRGLRRWLRER